MKLTKSKLKQIIKEETTRGLKEEVIDLGKYKAKKEREGMKDTVLVTKEPSYSGEHTIYDPGEFELVVVDTEEQYTALLQGDFSKAEDLGAQFDTIMFGMDPPLYEKKGKQTSQDIRRGNHRMKLTKSKLKQIIKEEIENIQSEGWNPFKKEENREERLLRITTEDFLTGLGDDGEALLNTGEYADIKQSAEKDIQDLVDQIMDVEPSEFNLCGEGRPCNPRNEGPRDGKWERRIRSLARQYNKQLR